MDVESRWAKQIADMLPGCYPMLLRLARELLGNAQDAEDAVQDTLLYLLEHPQEETKGPGWLWVCVRNHCCNVLRKRHKERQELPRIRDFLLHFDPADLAEDDRFEEKCNWLRDAIAELSPAERKVMRPFLKGQPLEEIASTQNANLETVKRTYRRGIERLGHIAREGVTPRSGKRSLRRRAPLVRRKSRSEPRESAAKGVRGTGETLQVVQ